MRNVKTLFRIDAGRTHGWQMRIIRNGERHAKLFSDSVHGHKEKAREAAVVHKDELLDELPDLPEGEIEPAIGELLDREGDGEYE